MRTNDETSIESIGQISTDISMQTILTFSSGFEFRNRLSPSETRAALTQFFAINKNNVDVEPALHYEGEPFYFQLGLSAPVSRYYSKGELGAIDAQFEKTFSPIVGAKSFNITLNPVFKSWFSSRGPSFHHFSAAINLGLGVQVPISQKPAFRIENTMSYETQLFFDRYRQTDVYTNNTGIWVFWPTFHNQTQLTLECSKEIALFLLGRLSTDTRQSIDKQEVALGLILHFE